MEDILKRIADALQQGDDQQVGRLAAEALGAGLPAGEIGVTLNDSCLMSPLKSVSGVLVAGLGEAHRFRPDFPFCDDCRTHECGRRMASVLGHAPRAARADLGNHRPVSTSGEPPGEPAPGKGV